MKIEKISKEDLESSIQDTLKSNKIGREQWIRSYLDAIVRNIKRDPRQYRSYGAYWWVLRSELDKHGLDIWSSDIEVEVVQSLDYGDSGLNLAAAHAYYENRFSRGIQYDSVHELLQEDGDYMEFVSNDPDLEALIR